MKFSIITICKNNLNGLKDTFQGISNQRCQDYEWIVIDGDSSDGTKEWFFNHHVATSIPGKFISEPDSGIFEAMNKGLDIALGEYVIFMNSGDSLYDKSTLQKLSDVIEQYSRPALVYGDSIDVTPNNKQYYRMARPLKFNPFTGFARHQAMAFQRKCIMDLRYDEKYRFTADIAFISSVLQKLHLNNMTNIVKINFPVCYFMLGGTHERHRFFSF